MVDAAVPRETLNDRFYRFRGSEASSSGLGLSIVRQIAERHQGRIALGGGNAADAGCA